MLAKYPLSGSLCKFVQLWTSRKIIPVSLPNPQPDSDGLPLTFIYNYLEILETRIRKINKISVVGIDGGSDVLERGTGCVQRKPPPSGLMITNHLTCRLLGIDLWLQR